jgi:DNA-directed RNA polymerase sigma subunit (sigma70/sigma32)
MYDLSKELNSIIKTQSWTSAQVTEAAIKYKQTQEDKYKDIVVFGSLRPIFSEIKKRSWASAYVGECLDTCVAGILEALERFEPEKGYQFNTYSHFYVQKELNDFRQGISVIQLPRDIFLRQHKSDFSDKERRHMMLSQTASLDAPIRDEDGNRSDLKCFVDAGGASALEAVLGASMVEKIKRLAMDLPAKEREAVMTMHFGECEIANVSELAKVLGIQRATANDRYTKAMTKIRRQLDNKSGSC